MKNFKLLAVLAAFAVYGVMTIHAQPVTDDAGDVVVGTTAVDPSAIFELVSNNKGMLVPRMTTAQMNAIPSPAEGLVVYNTDDFTFYVWSSASGSSQWDALVSTGNNLAWLTAGNTGLVDGADNFFGTNDATPIRMRTSGTTRLIVEPDGDVAINTGTAANARVQVVAGAARSGVVSQANGSGSAPGAANPSGMWGASTGGNAAGVVGYHGGGLAPFYVNVGVSGASDQGHGVAGNSLDPGSAGVFGNGTLGAYGVLAQSSTGVAGRFQITSGGNSSDAVQISTNGSGDGLNVAANGGGNAVVATGDVVPSATNSYDLGSSTQRWNEIFVNGLSSIHLGTNGDEAHITYNHTTDVFGIDFDGGAPEVSITDAGTLTATTFVGNGTVPLGGIIMWSGTVVPTGWALCDGTSGTPDLRGKFVLGSAGPFPSFPSTNQNGHGTTTSGTLSTSVSGAHSHGLAGNAPQPFGFVGAIPLTLGGATRTSTDGSHDHIVGIPYYALAYIMRIQ